jgi:N-acetylmuramoyl-L-alanine amidase
MRKSLALLAAAVLGIAVLVGAAGAGATSQEAIAVCLDPGHGGQEFGAIYTKGGRSGFTLVEKEINLDVALHLRDRLETAGFGVVMTRQSDESVSLEERVKICNDSGADIAVSIHTNSTYSARWDGSMTLMNKDLDRPLAETVQPIMYDGLKENWDGRFTDYGIKVDDWFFPKNTNMPAVILEPVFMSNPDEAAALRATVDAGGRRALIVQVEYEGIVSYFGEK